jgi:hypothetical protein
VVPPPGDYNLSSPGRVHTITSVRLRLELSIFFILITAPDAICQGTIATVAGVGYVDNIAAVQERLDEPLNIAVDRQGNAYLGDAARLLRIDAKTNKISTVAGNGNTNNYVDGSATSVSLSGPNSLAWDAKGNLVFLDAARAMRFNPSAGTLTTIAGGYGLTTPSYGIMTASPPIRAEISSFQIRITTKSTASTRLRVRLPPMRASVVSVIQGLRKAMADRRRWLALCGLGPSLSIPSGTSFLRNNTGFAASTEKRE